MCIAGVGVAFLVLLYTDYWHSAALMEWTITYLGALWIGTFAGYIRYVDMSHSRPLTYAQLTLCIDSAKLAVSPSETYRPSNSLF